MVWPDFFDVSCFTLDVALPFLLEEGLFGLPEYSNLGDFVASLLLFACLGLTIGE